MTDLIVWGRYPSVLTLMREGAGHIEGFGDDLLWWLQAIIYRLEEAGYSVKWGDSYEVSGSEKVDDSTVLMLLDYPSKRCCVASTLFDLVPKSRRLLIRLESPVISPSSYEIRELQEIGALARVEPGKHDDLVRHVRDFFVPLPEQLPDLPVCAGRVGVCAISSHKRIAGKRGQMYKLREEVYRDLSQAVPDFTLYGAGWDKYVSGFDYLDLLIRKLGFRGRCLAPKNLRYGGLVADKSVIANHHYAVVIENYLGELYISEKVFDCLKYGVKPVYIGGVDVESIGLAELVIQVSEPREIVTYLAKAPPPQEITTIRRSYKAWLKSKPAQRFTENSCFQTLADLLGLLASR